MKCAYCGKEARGTREHIISSAILDLFPECYITFDDARNAIHGLFEVGLMRKYASGGKYEYKELCEKEWLEEEKKISKEHPRGK